MSAREHKQRAVAYIQKGAAELHSLLCLCCELKKSATNTHTRYVCRAVFLDADTMVLQNIDELFDKAELSASPDCGWPDTFNSGVFVCVPDRGMFEELFRFAQEKGSFDGK